MSFSRTHSDKLPKQSVDVRVEGQGADGLVIRFAGRLDSGSTAPAWYQSMKALATPPKKLTVDATEVDYCDGSGISLLFQLRRQMFKANGEFELVGLRNEFKSLFDRFTPNEFDAPEGEVKKHRNTTEELGRGVYQVYKDLIALISFVGELTVGLIHAVGHPREVRWKDALKSAEVTGVNALPIVLLISFLVGLIMAFQSAIPMRMFGATIYVADLISLSMVRELGPLMTAIVLAGRSGSAFAAELGTMKVNEEIDALTTMGLDPVKFLVVPRVMAAVVMTPLLTVFANLIGMVGGAVVMISLGFPLITYYNQVLTRITYGDFFGGLVKSFVFGILIAGVGCLRGLETGTGASAVGDSTTSAVVSGIILIVVMDGIFSVLYFYLGV